ncbi:hypothetical protein NCAS_0A13160 [Naumovozyma castellii]|uniref:Uncharacterized protein n=1 Tax=Naumovozyma castellii TaxID=27288 RepID=G0V8S5_NAUCA|nr:hypothetical protein NCAS_0A13160 [Naumovozyma castellii CBS 4309]CCC67874.1 hypothetical protein NCAS_0A13160 [Naumovozyma castellii CBS 4309]
MSISPTFKGYVDDEYDAALIIQAVLDGKLGHVPRRLHDAERPQLIVSGNVFVFLEELSGIKRWTDGISWSPSRVSGKFLMYKELNKHYPDSINVKGPIPLKPKFSTTNEQSGNHDNEIPSNNMRQFLPSQNELRYYPSRYTGFVKKTFSVKFRNQEADAWERFHVISYYSEVHVAQNQLIRPRDLSYFNDVQLSPNLVSQIEKITLGAIKVNLEKVEKKVENQFKNKNMNNVQPYHVNNITFHVGNRDDIAYNTLPQPSLSLPPQLIPMQTGNHVLIPHFPNTANKWINTPATFETRLPPTTMRQSISVPTFHNNQISYQRNQSYPELFSFNRPYVNNMVKAPPTPLDQNEKNVRYCPPTLTPIPRPLHLTSSNMLSVDSNVLPPINVTESGYPPHYLEPMRLGPVYSSSISEPGTIRKSSVSSLGQDHDGSTINIDNGPKPVRSMNVLDVLNHPDTRYPTPYRDNEVNFGVPPSTTFSSQEEILPPIRESHFYNGSSINVPLSNGGSNVKSMELKNVGFTEKTPVIRPEDISTDSNSNGNNGEAGPESI